MEFLFIRQKIWLTPTTCFFDGRQLLHVSRSNSDRRTRFRYHSIHDWSAKKLWAAANKPAAAIYDLDNNLGFNFSLNVIPLMYLRIDVMKLVFWFWWGDNSPWFNFFLNDFFSFWIKWFSVLNQIIFRFKSWIVLNYVLNRSRVNVIVKLKSSKPIILELKSDAGRDTVIFGSIRNSPLYNKDNIVSGNQTPVDQSVLNANTL